MDHSHIEVRAGCQDSSSGGIVPLTSVSSITSVCKNEELTNCDGNVPDTSTALITLGRAPVIEPIVKTLDSFVQMTQMRQHANCC